MRECVRVLSTCVCVCDECTSVRVLGLIRAFMRAATAAQPSADAMYNLGE